MLEIAFRLAQADERLDENEIKFIRFLRGKLKLPDAIIKDRFGFVEYRFDKDYTNDIVKQDIKKEAVSTFIVPDTVELKEFDFKTGLNNER